MSYLQLVSSKNQKFIFPFRKATYGIEEVDCRLGAPGHKNHREQNPKNITSRQVRHIVGLEDTYLRETTTETRLKNTIGRSEYPNTQM